MWLADSSEQMRFGMTARNLSDPSLNPYAPLFQKHVINSCSNDIQVFDFHS
jgi:hypothetical protein